MLVIAHDEGNTLCPIDKLPLPCSKISVLMPEKPEKRLSFMRPTEPRIVTCETTFKELLKMVAYPSPFPLPPPVIVTDCNLEQPEKALAPILVTESPIDTDAKLEQP